ncbi:DUF397 domain-containing protein [Streptomyces sp. NPDC051018]|uniref:DUF397 domain-containing protein n=1 Tax=Streptomyces sp. NPDC051018 TaxID=3365639 RepID=UPI0037880369
MISPPALSNAKWSKSTYSGNGGGNCVEHAPSFAASGMVPVRDSKDPQGPALVFSVNGWRGFISAVKDGTFDA